MPYSCCQRPQKGTSGRHGWRLMCVLHSAPRHYMWHDNHDEWEAIILRNGLFFSNTLPPIISPGSGGGHFCGALRKYTVSRLNLLRLSSRLRRRRQPHSARCLIWASEIKRKPTGTQVELVVTWNRSEPTANACENTRADKYAQHAERKPISDPPVCGG